MQLQVTEIDFDFQDDWDFIQPISNEERQRITNELIGQIWEVDNEDDLVEKITCATGWCIESIDYRHILS